jgi:predicted  nucleic acid-binding Zn-ribbon protein
MDVLVILWSASVFAAVSFFAAGLATHAAMARRRAAPEVGASEAVDDARAREQHAHRRAAELESTMARVQEELRMQSERVRLASDELERTRAAAQRSEAELAKLRTTAAAADHRVTTAETRASAAETRASAAETRASAADGRASAAETRASAAEGRIAAAESRAVHAENRATVLEKKIAATELELGGMKERIAALDTELAIARPAKPKPAPARRAVVTELHGDTVESSLAARLGTFADECGYEVVVLSDAQGLLLAGVGDEQVQGTIAALSSVARELTTRAAEFVELRPKLIEVTDETGRSLRIRLFQWEQEPIALASFGMGHTEPTAEEETVITVFPSLMEAS